MELMESIHTLDLGPSERQTSPLQHMPTVAATPEERDEERGGVLLYYKYIDLGGEDRRAVVKEWYHAHCQSENLRGRVRVALDGVNCTLGGSMTALRRHIASVTAHEVLRGGDIDFKLSASRGARNSQAAKESGFTTLSVKAVKEVVSLGPRGTGLSHLEGGRHVTPQEFHRLLQEEAARKRTARAGVRDIGGEASLKASTTAAAVDASETAATVAGGGSLPTPTQASVDRRGHPTDERPVRAASLGRRSEEDLSLSAKNDVMATGGSGIGSVGEGGGGNEKQGWQSDVFEHVGGCVPATAAAGSPGPASSREKDAVLLDVRNVYETSIGRFSVEGVETLDPKTRQFSDLPKWVDENIDRLRGKRVLMYCTGGVRCEMASALIRRHCCQPGSSDTEVLQLSGGIERYLQAYPQRHRENTRAPTAATGDDVTAEEEEAERRETEGGDGGGSRGCGVVESSAVCAFGAGTEEGFFRGKNFVFDERVSVPETPAGGMAMGNCLLCGRPWDDYGSRSRCSRCRMLVLICDACIDARGGGGGGGEELAPSTPPQARPSPDPSRGKTDTTTAVGIGGYCGGSGQSLPASPPQPPKARTGGGGAPTRRTSSQQPPATTTSTCQTVTPPATATAAAAAATAAASRGSAAGSEGKARITAIGELKRGERSRNWMPSTTGKNGDDAEAGSAGPSGLEKKLVRECQLNVVCSACAQRLG